MCMHLSYAGWYEVATDWKCLCSFLDYAWWQSQMYDIFIYFEYLFRKKVEFLADRTLVNFTYTLPDLYSGVHRV